MKYMNARYPGVCYCCGGRFEGGTQIAYDSESGNCFHPEHVGKEDIFRRIRRCHGRARAIIDRHAPALTGTELAKWLAEKVAETGLPYPVYARCVEGKIQFSPDGENWG
jgi:hypothetical protein